MTSISGSAPSLPAYQPAGKNPIDNDTPRQNPLDKKAGEDAEVSYGKGGWKNISNETRAHTNRTRLDQNFLPPNKKIEHRNPYTKPAIPPSDNKIVDGSQNNIGHRNPLTLPAIPPSDNKIFDDSQINAHREPIDFEIKPRGNPDQPKASTDQEPMDVEIKSDGKGGWVMADNGQHPIDHEIQSDGNGGWVKA